VTAKRRRTSLARATVLAAFIACLSATAAHAETYRSNGVYARVTQDAVTLGNPLVERRWDRDGFRTAALVDKRGPNRRWSEDRRDFSLRLAGGAEIGSRSFDVTAVEVQPLQDGGLRVDMTLTGPPGIMATRTAEAYPGIAGFRTQTTLESVAPLALAGATLDEAAVGRAEPTIHAFRAGADWREPDWEGPPLFVGNPHPGSWRDTHSGDAGEPVEGPAQWVSAGSRDRSLFMVMERNDQPSSRAGYDGEVASLELDYTRDVVILGPFEEEIHVENPVEAQAGRQRVVRPGSPFRLEAAFTGFGRGDGDEPWQHHRYLTERRLAPVYERAVTFNSNGTDANRISTGAKDDMDFATIQEVAPIARRLGVETFILDDGWQARSGDWHPDSPEHPEPRWNGSPDSKFKPRFPDAEFRAVREAIAPMRLGLWMSPMHFHPGSRTFNEHPEWACGPAGHGTALANAIDPQSGSNEAGIGTWGPDAIPHVESRIRDAIENWGVVYFKFDFLVWLDCAGQGDLYDYREAFIAMLDRLRRDHPHVTLQIDETNDYRLFPFESVARGPSWFQNGTPEPERLLHNIWNLGPYVPAFSLGQHFLGGEAWQEHTVDTLMAVALPSHFTFFDDLRELPAEVVDRAAVWLDFYKANRGLFTQMTYPLLADPLGGGWTALQPWDPDRGWGALLAFRQQSESPEKRIALRNVPGGRRYDLFRAPDGALVGTVTARELRRGLTVTVPEKDGAAVFAIRPARPR
jgi:hypothetical protein